MSQDKCQEFEREQGRLYGRVSREEGKGIDGIIIMWSQKIKELLKCFKTSQSVKNLNSIAQ